MNTIIIHAGKHAAQCFQLFAMQDLQHNFVCSPGMAWLQLGCVYLSAANVAMHGSSPTQWHTERSASLRTPFAPTHPLFYATTPTLNVG